MYTDIIKEEVMSLDIDFFKLNTLYETVNKQYDIKIKELDYKYIYTESIDNTYDELYMETEEEKNEKKKGILSSMFNAILNFIRKIRVKILKLFGKDDKAKEIEAKIRSNPKLANQTVEIINTDDAMKVLDDENKFLKDKMKKVANGTITAKDAEEVKKKRSNVLKIIGGSALVGYTVAGVAGTVAGAEVANKKGIKLKDLIPYRKKLEEEAKKLNQDEQILENMSKPVSNTNLSSEATEASKEVADAVKENVKNKTNVITTSLNDINRVDAESKTSLNSKKSFEDNVKKPEQSQQAIAEKQKAKKEAEDKADGRATENEVSKTEDNTINESQVFLENTNISDIRNVINKIYQKYLKDKKPPTGNQNCQLCTWCVESWFRGINVLPRPIYSPTDIVFKFNGYDIVKNPELIKFRSKEDFKRVIHSSGNGSRYYVHAKWNGGSGGHEFMAINIDNIIYIIDAQQGIIENMDTSYVVKDYFNINYDESYMVRLDNKQFNKELLKYNNKYIKQLTEDDMKMLEENAVDYCKSKIVESYNKYKKDYERFLSKNTITESSYELIKERKNIMDKSKVFNFIDELEQERKNRAEDNKFKNSTSYKYKCLDSAKDEAREKCLSKSFEKFYLDAIPLNDEYKTANHSDLCDDVQSFIKKQGAKSMSYYVGEARKKSPVMNKLYESVEKLVDDKFKEKEENIDKCDPETDLVFKMDGETEKKIDVINQDLELDDIAKVISDNVKSTAMSEITRAKEEKENMKQIETDLANDINVKNEAAIERELSLRGINQKAVFQPSLFEGIMIGKLNKLSFKTESSSDVYLYNAMKDYTGVFYENSNSATVEEIAFVESVREMTLLSMEKALKIKKYSLKEIKDLANDYAMMT